MSKAHPLDVPARRKTSGSHAGFAQAIGGHADAAIGRSFDDRDMQAIAPDTPVLICYDGSDEAAGAIAAAAGLFGHRPAVVLDVGPLEMVAETFAAAGSGAADLDHLTYETALARAEKGAELARAAGLRAEARADVNAPTWLGVTETAEEIGAAAIVIGARHLNRLRRLFETSVSHDVVTHANRPVLVVPARRRA